LKVQKIFHLTFAMWEVVDLENEKWEMKNGKWKMENGKSPF
jgi:hypothetical protein